MPVFIQFAGFTRVCFVYFTHRGELLLYLRCRSYVSYFHMVTSTRYAHKLNLYRRFSFLSIFLATMSRHNLIRLQPHTCLLAACLHLLIQINFGELCHRKMHICFF